MTAVSGFRRNGDSRVTLSRERVTNEVRKGDSGGAKGCQPCHPNPSMNTYLILPADRETGAGAPRGLEGLGPPPETESKRLTNGPLGDLEPGLRDLLEEDYRRLAMAELKGRTADTVTLSVMTPTERDTIRKHCEAAILKVSGASKLEFVVELAVEPPSLRRLQLGPRGTKQPAHVSRLQTPSRLTCRPWSPRICRLRQDHARGLDAPTIASWPSGARMSPSATIDRRIDIAGCGGEAMIRPPCSASNA